VSPAAAMLVGAVAGSCCYVAIVWKGRVGYDDTLDVLGTHGIGGIVGTLATGIFASTAVNPLGADGLFAGNSSVFGAQVTAVVAVVLYSFLGTYAVLKLMEGSMGLRVAQEEEATGLDLSQHNERAYS
jgi:Amt family ammonium transporter